MNHFFLHAANASLIPLPTGKFSTWRTVLSTRLYVLPVREKYGDRRASERDSLSTRFHRDDAEQNAVTCKTCCKTIAAKGHKVIPAAESHPLQNEEFQTLSMSPHTPEKALNKPAVTPATG